MSTTAATVASELAYPLPSSVRERLGITLEEIAASTRIACHYLRAIEADEFAKLPAGAYATSYIRQYAQAISYSETALLEEYRIQTQNAAGPGMASPPPARPTSRLGEALTEAKQLFHWLSPAKPRTRHAA